MNRPVYRYRGAERDLFGLPLQDLIELAIKEELILGVSAVDGSYVVHVEGMRGLTTGERPLKLFLANLIHRNRVRKANARFWHGGEDGGVS